jgi:hypothetical protein
VLLKVVGAAAVASAASSGVSRARAANPLLANLHFGADDLQKHIYQQEKQISGNSGSAKSDAAESARDRRSASLDNIQKFLDVLRSMNPQI